MKNVKNSNQFVLGAPWATPDTDLQNEGTVRLTCVCPVKLSFLKPTSTKHKSTVLSRVSNTWDFHNPLKFCFVEIPLLHMIH